MYRFRFLVVSLSFFVHTAIAGEYEDGVAAFERKDYTTAFTKFRSAAQKGNATAQTLVGAMYHNGQGVVQDYKEAMRWYRLAALQGDALAQYHLGIMYEQGKGVIQDNPRAHMWFNIAGINGGILFSEARGIVERKMTPQQIEQAQRMARECMTSNFKKCD